MIVGLGIDVIEIKRIRKAVDRYEQHFLRHVFRDDECADAPASEGRYAFYAGRWAAKEAVSKVLGTGIGDACGWTDIHVRRGTNGKPLVKLSGQGAKTAAGLGIESLYITISHEGALACAAAVAESR